MEGLNFKQRLTGITTLIFDIDGVLTDGKVLVMDSGEMVRNINSKDGYAFHQAVMKGYRVVIISGGNNEAVKRALERSGIKDIFIRTQDKLTCYVEYLAANQLKDEEVMFMGDDLPDYKVMARVGIAACPNDAAQEIRAVSIYVSPRNGGEGCVRDIIEQVLKAQGKWSIENW
jgi:3-deoxy-D-manno-octulosonate 8-phosphate phosphatase (KDO 8-P phosphatase)